MSDLVFDGYECGTIFVVISTFPRFASDDLTL